MLKTFEVKDYALIEHIKVEFNTGLNIITGETGAGKSILVDAMSLLLGERASTEVVRKGTNKSVVEGIFEVTLNKKVKAILEENEIDFLPELILRREISVKGSNRCFINDTPVSLNLIKEVGNLLVDIHGQHEHQSLLRKETHINFLDDFTSAQSLLEDYRKIFTSLTDSINELNHLKEKESLLKEKKELYEFQIKEIDAVSPLENEDEQIISELKILENSEKLMQLTADVYSEIYEKDNSIYDSLIAVKKNLNELLSIDNNFADILKELESALAILDNASSFVRDYNSRIEADPEKLESLRQRLGSIILLKKKYGGSITKVLEHRKKIGEEFELAQNFSSKISEYQKGIDLLRNQCGIAADKLSLKRKEASKKIKKEVENVLQELGIANAVFEINIQNEKPVSDNESYLIFKGEKIRCSYNGFDEVEFFISTNQGEDVKPLAKVASGGEVSRIMLSLKSALAKNDKLPLLIFDEIDTGISGRIAQKVGHALKSLSTYHQIISITHLPQIAGLADNHFAVRKTQNSTRTTSEIIKLNFNERVNEVAKLISGEIVTEAALLSAQELMGIK